MPPLLELKSIGKTLAGEGRSLFRNISAVVDEPAVIHLLGASGQGKTSLLRILARLDAPEEGAVIFKGKTAAEWDPRIWRRHIGFVFQQPNMIEGTVDANLRLGSVLHEEVYDSDLAGHLLAEVGLGDLPRDKRAADLSGGEKQRIALVRSLLMQPDILLLDEVTSSLDARHAQSVEQTLTDWHDVNGTTLIWVTHSAAQARKMGTRVWFMANGELVEDRPTEAFFASPATDAARSYLAAAYEGED